MEEWQTVVVGCNMHGCIFPLLCCVSEAGAVDGLDEETKEKYCNLVPSHLFTPVLIEMSGSFGPQTLDFVKELDHCLR